MFCQQVPLTFYIPLFKNFLQANSWRCTSQYKIPATSQHTKSIHNNCTMRANSIIGGISNVFLNSQRAFIWDVKWMDGEPRVLHSLKAVWQNSKKVKCYGFWKYSSQYRIFFVLKCGNWQIKDDFWVPSWWKWDYALEQDRTETRRLVRGKLCWNWRMQWQVKYFW